MSRQLRIGTLTDSDDAAPAVLEASRFNRHTFWCGQSGSGKTYALGVVLEQLLLGTQMPILIIDPNGDFTRLADVREGVDPDAAAALQELDIRVLRSGQTGKTPLKIRLLASSDDPARQQLLQRSRTSGSSIGSFGLAARNRPRTSFAPARAPPCSTSVGSRCCRSRARQRWVYSITSG
jgi:DNA helicase HerA-like ATPase